MNDNVALNMLMLDNFFFPLFLNLIVRDKMSVQPPIFYVVVMRVVVKGDVFDFI